MLTIRVYRVRPDGTRTKVLSTVTVRTTARDQARLPLQQGYPPCRCPRCREEEPPGRPGRPVTPRWTP